jgi:hypothetical protein
MSKYGDLIKKAREPENQNSGKPEDHQAPQEDPEVNLCVKVPLSLRRHWGIRIKAYWG